MTQITSDHIVSAEASYVAASRRQEVRPYHIPDQHWCPLQLKQGKLQKLRMENVALKDHSSYPDGFGHSDAGVVLLPASFLCPFSKSPASSTFITAEH